MVRALATWLLFAGLLLAGCGDRPAPAPGGAFQGGLAELLGQGDPEGFKQAMEVRPFRFPRDHRPHRGYRNEWWYVTGNLTDDDGRRFGFQLTFFRLGLAPGRDRRASRWATHQAWMAHFAVTDVQGEAFHAFERFGRGGDLGLAGARTGPVAVWLEDWRLERRPDGRWRLQAAADALRLELGLEPVKAPVPQGDRGLSRKSKTPGNAMYYYSLPRLEATGRIEIGQDVHSVAGSAWLDREWGTSALGPEQVGWDWFALQLADGTDVMIYRLRQADGTASPWSAGTVVSPDGRVTRLAPGDFDVRALDRWTSPDGATYPAGWRLHIGTLEEPLTVRPVSADQELDASVRYWEGAVDVYRAGESAGVGYVELTGYAGETEILEAY